MLFPRVAVAIVHLAAALVTLYIASVGAPILLASDCVAASQQQAYQAAVVVFRGSVVKIEDTAATVDPVDRDTGKLALQPVSGFKIVTVAVSRVWKGPSTSTIQLFVLEHPSMGTGFQFRVGSEYVIYALDDVEQNWSEIRRFSQQSRVYGIAVGCTLRVRVDVDAEARSLDARVRKELESRSGGIKR
jgi:hypothetical protein